ncbi:AlpA family phage regulatory protein [Pandoraea sputorum]|nr:AlpA family phage regulatory protein [Pandoraea sputorum]
MKAGEFPKSVPPTRGIVAWIESEIPAWIESGIKIRDARAT